MKIIIFFFIILSFIASPVFAEKKESSKGAAGDVIDLGDELIEGYIEKPDLLYLLRRKKTNFGRLLKLRENFLPEMRESFEAIPRGGKRRVY